MKKKMDREEGGGPNPHVMDSSDSPFGNNHGSRAPLLIDFFMNGVV